MAPADWFLHRSAVLPRLQCEQWARDVYAARPLWTPCFEEVQFTLGRAYYSHLEEGVADQYFAEARASDALVERALPGMHARVGAILADLLGAPVAPRPGWCGPGVHVFPAGGWLSEHGGDVHFDIEGLADEDLAARTPAVSVILMLQPPTRGGGLRVWDARYDGDDQVAEPEGIESTVVEYAAGDLVAIDSYRLHQIQPFAGTRDRVSITTHAVLDGDCWLAWF